MAIAPISQIELSRLLDVKPATIRAWEARGCPIEHKAQKKGEASLYSVAEVVRWREAQAAMAASGDLSAMDMEEAKRRKLSAEAALVEIDLAKARGNVVEVAVAAKEIGDALSACRSRLLGVGASVAPRLDLAPDTASRKEMIDDAINEALDEISSTAFEFASGSEGDSPEGDQDPAEGADAPAAEADVERVGRRQPHAVGRKLGGTRAVANKPG